MQVKCLEWADKKQKAEILAQQKFQKQAEKRNFHTRVCSKDLLVSNLACGTIMHYLKYNLYCSEIDNQIGRLFKEQLHSKTNLSMF